MATQGALLSPLHHQFSKRNPKPFRSPGGKDAWVKVLMGLAPEHKVYVEPYAGSASLFWAKEPSEKEILAEIDGDIIAVYQFLQTASDTDFEWMRKQLWKSSSSQFAKLKAPKPTRLRERAYQYKYLNLYSIRGACEKLDSTDAGRSPTGRIFLSGLERFRERLDGVEILHKDALAVIAKYDSPDTFFYLDPPWKPAGVGEGWTDFDETEFINATKRIKGRVLISYQGKLDLGAKWGMKSMTLNQAGFAAPSTQQLYWNYKGTGKQQKFLNPGNAFDEDYFVGMDGMDVAFITGLAEVSKHIRGEMALEIGPGLGRGMDVLKAGGERTVHGIEISRYAVQKAQARGHEVFHIDGAHTSFADSVYDSVFSIGVLQYVPDVAEIVKESVRVAKSTAIHLIPIGPPQDDFVVRSWDSFEEVEKYVSDNQLGAGFRVSVVKVQSGFAEAGVLIIDKEIPASSSGDNEGGEDPSTSDGLGGFDFQEGDEGLGVIQTHETGLTQRQAQADASLGWEAVGGIPEGISAHTDIRLVRGDDGFWEGGELLTNEDLEADNLLKQIADGAEDVEILANLSPPSEPEERDEEQIRKEAICTHSTSQHSEKPWSAMADRKRLLDDQPGAFYAEMFAWRDPDGDRKKKGSYKFPHHEVDNSGRPGPANINACRSGIAVLNGARGGAAIPEADFAGVHAHLAKHLEDAGLKPAPLRKRGLVRGDLSWMGVGTDGPRVLAPNSTGSQDWSRFLMRDTFKWQAGVQKSTLKEFFFDGAQISGRWVFTKGEDGWVLTRPADQDFGSEELQKFVTETESHQWFSPFINIEKAEDKRLVTSVVLKPEVTDAQEDIISEDEIEKTAHGFLADYNRRTKIGFMHKDFRRKLQLVESWVTKNDQIINGKKVLKGSWLVTVKVIDDMVWKAVKAGKIRGFSVGGRARAQRIA